MCSTSFPGSLFSASGTRLHGALFLAGVQFSRLPRVLVFFLVVFDLLFAFGVLSCRILDSASLFILYVHEHDRPGFGMLTMETAVFDCFQPRQKRSVLSGRILFGILNRWKSTLTVRSIRVNLNHRTEM